MPRRDAIDAVRAGATFAEAAGVARMRIEDIQEAVRAWRHGDASSRSFGAQLDAAHSEYVVEQKRMLAAGKQGQKTLFDVLAADRARGGWSLPAARDDVVAAWTRWGEEHNTLDEEHDAKAREQRFDAWRSTQEAKTG